MGVLAGNGGAAHGDRWRVAIWGLAALMLLTPLVAMQFTREVTWDAADFIVFGTMLVVACGTYELAARATGSGTYRAAVGIAVATAFLLVWINLAVGIIGSEGNPANLMFGGVLAVAVVGALVAQFRPGGMTYALIATAGIHALVAVIAVAGLAADLSTLMLNGFFVALWLVSAGLFRRAARDASRA
ncbi:hypothetical protein IAG41_16490 [Sphingomonas sp. JC676]|uniref:hypothetical protein n=1 Tax=Sphingomonas sp. JC676 TaxID=2768065 RepID=UPI001658639E|nr:hypothetical protein [Sphingomonas sp. JC676]MBC9033990.1 hypothetical protein [Sphingomonas sp. JC676]